MASLNLIIVSAFVLLLGILFASQPAVGEKHGLMIKALRSKSDAIAAARKLKLDKVSDKEVAQSKSKDIPEIRAQDYNYKDDNDGYYDEENKPNKDGAFYDCLAQYYAYPG